MDVKYDLTGTMTSEIKISKETGWTINSSINQDISGNVEFKDNPQMPGGMTVPMSINTTMKMTDK
jgi:hypothetical protein